MNDKKKLLIIGVLGAVLLGIGAFQFMGPSSPPTIEDPGEETGSTTGSAEPAGGAAAPAEAPKDPVRDQLIQLISTAATPRDPFRASGQLATEFANSPTKVAPASASPAAGTPPPPPKAPSFSQPVAPMNPLPGGFPDGPVGLRPEAGVPPFPGEPVRNTSGPGYKVRGVIVGKSRLVVLEDSDGNQRLVPEGGSVDGDTTIVGVKEGSVAMRVRGQKHEVKLEEDRR